MVTATEVLTNLPRSSATNGQGYYVISSLRPSTYTISVQATGFRKYNREDIVLLADHTLTVDADLTIGSTSESVTVSATPPQVDTTTGTLRQVVDQARMLELPLNGRNAATLTTLVAGAVSAPNNGAFQSSTFGNQRVGGEAAAVTVSTNGSKQTAVNYQMDGGDNMDQYTNVNQPFPMPDSVQEFSVQTSNYSAQYGQNSGAIVDVVTKSGTNEFHGNLFEFVRNSEFNARNWANMARDVIKRNQFGGTLGGPVRVPKLYNGKDKTFFFFGYQGTRFRYISSSAQSYVPTQASLNGDFSAMLSASNLGNPLGRAISIKDPLTGIPFPGDMIPVSRFDPAALKTVTLLPSATTPNGLTRYSQPFALQDFNEETLRVDHSLSAKDRLTGRYFLDQYDNPPIYADGNILTYKDGLPNRSQNLLVQEIHVFSPTLLNDFRFTFSRVYGMQITAANSPDYNDLGVTMYQPTGVAKAIESISVSGLFSFGDHPLGTFVRNNYFWNNDLSWVHGRHSLSFGGFIQRAQLDVTNNYQRFGNFSFSGDATGYALADFLLGQIRTFGQGSGQYQNNRNIFINVYAQDTFHVTQRLTLNLGLRYEPYTPWNEIHGRMEVFEPAAYQAGQTSQVYVNAPPGLLFPGDSGFPSHGVKGDYRDFGPRFGFAYNPTGKGNTSLRGGFGVFYDSRVISQLGQYQVTINPFSPSLALTTPVGPFSNPYLGLTSHPPFQLPVSSNFVFPLPVTVAQYDPSTKFLVPSSYNWNLTLE
ncbi:MAG: carboxypeptidase regulatory-like domain-containing protein, partial [Candidatus Solibacter sp.]